MVSKKYKEIAHTLVKMAKDKGLITNYEDFIKTDLAKETTLTNKEVAKYIVKNPSIRNGQATLKGTRITTKELLMIMTEECRENDFIEYILKQYPSIDCEEKIIYGALYELNNTSDKP